MSIETIALWFKRARPAPTPEQFNVQLGCHFEEIAEMVKELQFTDPMGAVAGEDTELFRLLEMAAKGLKSGVLKASVTNKVKFADALGDQVVTSVGVGHCDNIEMVGVTAEVNRSNWSKFVDGQPVFNEHGKIAKGPGYTPPDLTAFL